MNTQPEQTPRQRQPERKENPEVEPVRAELRVAMNRALECDNQPTIDQFYADYTAFLANPDSPYIDDLPDTATTLKLSERFFLRIGFCNQKDDKGDYGKGQNIVMHFFDTGAKNPAEPIAAFTIREETPGRFHLAHRVVDPDYQKTRVGTWALTIIEGIAQKAANERGKEQILEANAGQYGLIRFLLGHKFEPDDPAQMQSIHDGVNNGAFLEWSPRPNGMPYLYKKGTPLAERKGLKTFPKYGVRIHLMKSFMPRQKSEG